MAKAKKARAAVAKGQKAPRRRKPEINYADPALFEPMSEGERAAALRLLLEDERLREIAKVGRYKVITVEPLATKPPDPMAGQRLARVVIYDYAGNRCVDGCVDLELGSVVNVGLSSAQPMLSREEETSAVQITAEDKRVNEIIAGTNVALGVFQYWSRNAADLASHRRSAAVVFGRAGVASHVVVVDLVDEVVVDVVPAEQW